jgi:signal transduction histidine kinase
MQYQKNRLRNLLVGFTVLLLAFFIYTQYRTFLNNITIARKQLQLNTLQGRILYLDEALIMSARTFVLTKDPQWNQRYRKLSAEFYSSISQFYTLFPGPIEGKRELDASMSSLMNMQLQAFDLVSAGRPEEAKSLLFGEEYKKQQEVYSSGLRQLTTSLDQAVNDLMDQHYIQAKRTTLIRGIIVILIILTWTWFTRVSRKWRREIEKVNHTRTEEAIASAEKLKSANDQLQQISAHLQEVREKERLALASEINEELGQQIAVMQLRIGAIQKTMNGGDQSRNAELQQVSLQLGEAMQFLRKLATDVYPLVLRDLGLVEALEWESERVSNQFVKVKFLSEIEDIQVDERTATLLFRSYQEKLQSLIGSGATEIMSTLRLENNLLELAIHDNATHDMDPENKTMEDMVIKERLRSIQGHSIIDSSPVEGNSFTISIPHKLDQ